MPVPDHEPFPTSRYDNSEGNTSAMRRREFLHVFGSAVVLPTGLQSQHWHHFGVWLTANRNSTGATKRVGFIEPTSKNANQGFLTTFKDELSHLGWTQGENLLILDRWAEARDDRLREIIDELVSANVDVLITAGGPATIAAKAATTKIPIVLVGVADPVAQGFVRSLSHPGGNITGLSSMSVELIGKQLQLLKEIVPRMMRIAAIINPDDPNSQTVMQDVPVNAERLGLAAVMLEVSTPTAIEHAFARLQHERCDGLWVGASAVTVGNRARIVSLAATANLPAIYPFRAFAVDGGPISYGTDYADLFRRAAAFVDKIFRGANPGDLPVEQPIKFELVLNLKAAKTLDINIPPVLLLQADEIVE